MDNHKLHEQNLQVITCLHNCNALEHADPTNPFAYVIVYVPTGNDGKNPGSCFWKVNKKLYFHLMNTLISHGVLIKTYQ